MISRAPLLVLLATLIATSGCGGKWARSGASEGSTSQTTTGDDSGAAAATCTRPDNAADASSGQCLATAYYLKCAGSAGGGELCASNDLTQCPGGDPIVGETFSNCVNQCDSTEYAMTCGGPGPAPAPSLPSGCRALPEGPGGGIVGCCPCGTPAATRFACGTSTCDSTSQVCEHVEGGPAPGVDFLECIPVPSECAEDVSCGCVDQALVGRGASGCTDSGGGVTVLIAVP